MKIESDSFYTTQEAVYVFSGNATAQYPGEIVVAAGLGVTVYAIGNGAQAVALGSNSTAFARNGGTATAMNPETHAEAEGHGSTVIRVAGTTRTCQGATEITR